MARSGYPPEFRRRAVELVEGGRKVAEVAANLEISEQTIYTWRRQARIDAGLEAGSHLQDACRKSAVPSARYSNPRSRSIVFSIAEGLTSRNAAPARAFQDSGRDFVERDDFTRRSARNGVLGHAEHDAALFVLGNGASPGNLHLP
jgi:transposase-like protein